MGFMHYFYLLSITTTVCRYCYAFILANFWSGEIGRGTSETEEQRKESLRIRREKDRARRRTKGKKRSPNTDDYEKQRLATLKRLKRGEVDLRLGVHVVRTLSLNDKHSCQLFRKASRLVLLLSLRPT